MSWSIPVTVGDFYIFICVLRIEFHDYQYIIVPSSRNLSSIINDFDHSNQLSKIILKMPSHIFQLFKLSYILQPHTKPKQTKFFFFYSQFQFPFNSGSWRHDVTKNKPNNKTKQTPTTMTTAVIILLLILSCIDLHSSCSFSRSLFSASCKRSEK